MRCFFIYKKESSLKMCNVYVHLFLMGNEHHTNPISNLQINHFKKLFSLNKTGLTLD